MPSNENHFDRGVCPVADAAKRALEFDLPNRPQPIRRDRRTARILSNDDAQAALGTALAASR
jgi:hypothetical protein